MKDKKALTTLNAIKKIYDRGIIKIPEISLEVDSGSEFKGVFSKYFKDKSINIRVAQTGRSRQQGLVESRNGSIANILLKCNLDDIIQINTDGFISKTIIKDLKISKDMGAWKIKHTGDCTIKNSNVVIWSLPQTA